jgi:hypothetical protein
MQQDTMQQQQEIPHNNTFPPPPLRRQSTQNLQNEFNNLSLQRQYPRAQSNSMDGNETDIGNLNSQIQKQLQKMYQSP